MYFPIYLRLSLFILLTFPFCDSFGQIYLEGYVRSHNEIPIPYVNVYMKEDPSQGTTTNEEGFFKFIIKTEESNPVIIFSGMGFKKKELIIKKGTTSIADILLEKEDELLDEVVLSAASNSSKEYTVSYMNKIDIYSNPTAGADPLRAILNMPYSSTTDETANPSFRGSNPDRSRVILNGVPVLNPVRNNQINGLGNFSLFNTEIIERQLIYPSNPPLTYGNSSAGIVEIETSEQVENTNQISVSLASIGALINQNINKSSFLQMYSNKQFDDVFKRVNEDSFDFLKKFSSFDFGLNYHLDFKLGYILR